ncbi:MAG: hypothetical protein QQN63_13780 [Nitrosopumilus sp.]
MTVIFPRKFIYYQTPRTASNSIQNSLTAMYSQGHRAVSQGAITLKQHSDFSDVPIAYRGLPGITTIRNPFDVICSWWIKCGSNKTISEWINEYTNDDLIRNKKLLYHAPHCTFIIRYERDMIKQINMVMNALDCGTISYMPFLNKTKPKTEHYSHYYKPKDIDTISKLFHSELNEFDYVFEAR